MTDARDRRRLSARWQWLVLGCAVAVLCASGLALAAIDHGQASQTAVTLPAADPPAPPAAAPPDAAAPARAGRTQLRGVWVHLFDDTLKTPGAIDRMLDRVAASGANTVVAEVVRRQDAYYRSDVLPAAPDPAVPDGFDPLAHLVRGAHARGLQLQAWVPVLPTYNSAYDALPSPPGWVHTAHGPDAPVDQRWVTRRADGTWENHLDPGHPAVRRHAVDVVTEIAQRYPVDGIHLDYLRYTGRDTGYNPTALARFRQATGRSDTPAPDDPQFSAWRRSQTRGLVAAIRNGLERTAPEVGLTAAVIAQGRGPRRGHPFAATPAHSDYFQDWVGWIEEGLLDAAMPMAYFRQAQHAGWFTAWTRFTRRLAADTRTVIAPGVAGYLNTPAAGRAQLAAAAKHTDGAVLYSYQQSTAAPPGDLLDQLAEGLWRRPARAPELG